MIENQRVVMYGGALGQKPRTLDPSASARAYFGAELRTWRERRGLSQGELGRMVHVSGALIGKLEKAQRRPLPDLVSLLDRVLEAEGDLRESCAAAEAQERARRTAGDPRPGPVDELAELTGPTTRLGAHAINPAVGRWVSWAQSQTPNSCRPPAPAPDPTTSVIMDRVRQLRLLDDCNGSHQILEWTLHDLRWARRVLRGLQESGAGSADLQPIQLAVGELAQLAGWIACDSGRHGRAERLWLLGLDAAQAVGDVRLGATIVSCLSYQALWLGETRAAVDLAAAARRGAAGWPGGAFQALLATREARAHAGAGNPNACEQGLAQASTFMAQAGPGDDPEWVYWVTPAVLAADAGRAWLDLGQPRRAADGLTRGLELFGQTQPRNQALHLTSLAAAHLADDQGDAAVAAVDAALDLLPVGDSQRVRERLSGLLPTLRGAGGTGRHAAERIHTVLVA